MKRLIPLMILGYWTLSGPARSAWAQSQDTAPETQASDEANEKLKKAMTAKTVLSEDLWTSARAAGLGGALSGMADGLDAPYYNPAGIGGIHQDKKQSGDFLRTLNFPFPAVGVSVNDNTVVLNNQFAQPNASSDPTLTKAVLDANAGKRQYARISVVPSLAMSRFFIGYLYDSQTAAVPVGGDSGLISTHQRISSGPGVGFSATDPNGTLYIGAFAASLSRSELNGDLSFGDFVDPESRKTAGAENTKHYSGTTSNFGILWRVTPRAGNPTLSLVSRNIGDTKFKSSDGGETIVVKENMVLGFTLAPKLGKWGHLGWTIEADQLMDPTTAVAKKLKSGLELTLGSVFGSSSIFGLRVGGNSAGASFGSHLNFGLLGFQVGSYAEDVGAQNTQVIERRFVGMFSINVAH